MNLPWFPFKIGDYVRDTMRLTTEGHGAYLLLMLDYYATGEAPPDDDDVLASIAKLPVEVWKAKHRRVLEPFFEVRDGHWHHARIEREIQEACSKHTQAVAKATKASAARYAGERSKHAPSKSQANLQDDISTSTTTLPPKGGVEALPPKVALQDLGKEIDPKFEPSLDVEEQYPALTMGDILDQRRKFVDYHLEKGSLSADWQASFRKWLDREITFREKHNKPPKAPPRVEVNVEPNWDTACVSWVKLGSWPRGIGPDPESPACRAPHETMRKYGIEPRSLAS